MARLSDADQGRFSLPRLHPRSAHCARPRAVPRPGETLVGAARHRHPGMVELLLQIADDAAGVISRARPVHPVHEAEEHAAPPEGRRADHASRAGVLRLEIAAVTASSTLETKSLLKSCERKVLGI